ncbi:MAG TPA: short-chain dehydrogenase/reductase, partial [Flavobacteriaceae bacterium]|nr:short-chain dehydrogenase/reductase [Flavobacteriaceae bacterium]
YHTPVFEDSAYKEKYKENLALMDAHVKGGMSPKIMAEAVYKIILTKHPRIHYKVGGFMEKFSIVLKRILPDKMYERMLMKHFEM